jgi:rhamnosyltransferase
VLPEIAGDENTARQNSMTAPEVSNIGIIIPTLNAAGSWLPFVSALLSQSIKPSQVLIVDSSSEDATVDLARASGFRTASINRADFNHGRTRQWAAGFFKDSEILVYLTQDAILASPDSIDNLVATFRDPTVGAAYGRQLPRETAGPIEAHARLFNYPEISEVRSAESRERRGFKSIFISNSFAAYRRTALEEVGGFPSGVIFGEDTVSAARLLLADWKIAYAAGAGVYHSHEYSLWQEFKRYFDIGALHSAEAWLLQEFGHATGEGRRFVVSEVQFLWRRRKSLIPVAVFRTLAKVAGYQCGKHHRALSKETRQKLSMHPSFWK